MIPIRFRRLPNHQTKEAANMVLSILSRHAPQGLSSKQLFDEAMTLYPPGPPLPPRNSLRAQRSAFGTNIQPMNEPMNHPLRSLRRASASPSAFLKSVVLKELQQQQQVDKSCVPVHENTLSEAERERFVVKGGSVGEPKAWRWTLADPEKIKKVETR
ncbi:hypothetical protein B0H19DRAFT_1269642 [Mycena capillaripes]|nr:hypothetical protein B0H19DRAFT_1269642 [Mycena capillaripes]